MNVKRQAIIENYAAFWHDQNIGSEGEMWDALDADDRANVIENCDAETVADFLGQTVTPDV